MTRSQTDFQIRGGDGRDTEQGDIVRLTLATGAHQAIGTGLGTPASFADGSRVG